MRPDDWRGRAECRDDPTPDLWHPSSDAKTNRAHIEMAKARCRPCPVRDACLAEAISDPDITGIWGGTTATERAALRGTLKPSGPKDIRHGTPGGARTHRKRGEEPCGPCTAAAKAANARYQQRKTMKRRYERTTS